MENKFYVYEHWRLDKNECFYVGKGFGNRAYVMAKRNDGHNLIQRLAKEDQFEIEVRIVRANLPEMEAFDLEKATIKHWRDLGIPITNRAVGGYGGSIGFVHTEEARKKMSDAGKGRLKSPEHKEKLRKALFRPWVREKAQAACAIRLKDPEFIERNRQKNIGQKRPEAMKEAMRRAWTPERREKRRIDNIALNKMRAERRALARSSDGAGAQG